MSKYDYFLFIIYQYHYLLVLSWQCVLYLMLIACTAETTIQTRYDISYIYISYILAGRQKEYKAILNI